jgi:uncharacterized protein YbjT (DUF2867 family)
MTGKSALLFGASGLVGGELLKCLLEADEYDRVINEYKKIDVDYPLQIARLAKENQVQNYLIVSAMGADKYSKFFYNRLKGLLEDELKKGKKEGYIVTTQLNLNYPIMGNPYQYINPGLISLSASAGTP